MAGTKLSSQNGSITLVTNNPLDNFTLTLPNTSGTLMTTDQANSLFNAWAADAILKDNLVFVSGTHIIDTSFASGVGQLYDFPYNTFKVYPPAGFTIHNLVAFIASNSIVYFAGIVDGNDILFCRHTVDYDNGYILVQAGNSEQRAPGYANYLGVWQK
jgi:hypothetical protein